VLVGPNGSRVRDPAVLERIRRLAIPPAWTDVWINPHPLGHLQATGRDARGRKQYRYHPRWRVVRDETKFGRMRAFAEALPRIRARTERDLAQPGLPRTKVLALVVRLLETTLVRVGNREYERANAHFGLTTMKDWHVDVAPPRLRFHFVGKSGKQRRVDVRDARLARLVQRCRDLPGWELFRYVDDDGRRHAVDASDVNAYLHDIAGEAFTAKDFRTWAGTVLAMLALGDRPAFRTKGEAKRNVVAAIAKVADQLGNTPSVCRKCYVHPLVIESYLAGSLPALLDHARAAAVKVPATLAALHEPERTAHALLGAAPPAPTPKSVAGARDVARGRAVRRAARRPRQGSMPSRRSR
jgi:DNA topoisomerase-1